jgi:hypothetical protein
VLIGSYPDPTYDWLVIAGVNAKCKGVGTINGEGEYRFVLTATDGGLLGGGNINIHKPRSHAVAQDPGLAVLREPSPNRPPSAVR